MGWTINYSDQAAKELQKMDRCDRELIMAYMRERIEGCSNPRVYGEPLRHNMQGVWRYRIGKYRILCELVDEEVMVYVVKIDHRRTVYVR